MLIAIDNETHLIRPALLAPPMVCLSIAHDVEHADVIHRNDPACERTIRELIEMALAKDVSIVGQNTPYDLAVWANEWPDLLEPIFQLFEDGRVLDTMTRQKFLDIAHGVLGGYKSALDGVFTKYKYHLADLAKRHEYPVDLDKDTWRLRYSELADIPVSEWPQGAVEYSAHDAMSTLWVALKQEEDDPRFLQNQHHRARAHWGLHLCSTWGIRTCPRLVARHRANTEARLAEYEALLLAEGLIVHGTKKGVPVIKKKVKLAQERAEANNPNFPKTDGGKPSLSADAADHYTDPVIKAFIEYSNAAGVISHIEELQKGVVYPIHTRFEELVETGRTSSSNPNIQNRAVKVGDRECFVPRKGMVLIDSDFAGLELCTVSQVCLWSVGFSRLAETLNAGGDPHAMIAAQLLDIPLEEVLKRKKDPNDEPVYLARQTGKVANFGLPAGLGWKSLIIQARSKYGVTLDEVSSKRLIETWHSTFPEFKKYFDWVKGLCGQSDHTTVIQYLSNRYRGLTPYTVACNSYFQGLGADATLAALWALQKECYVGTGPLRGSRLVNYIHDQFLVETPEEGAHEAAAHLEKVVVAAANAWLPDVPTKTSPMLTRRWSKLAQPWRDDTGRLVPWEWITVEGSIVDSSNEGDGSVLVACHGGTMVGGDSVATAPTQLLCKHKHKDPLANGASVRLTYSGSTPWMPEAGGQLRDAVLNKNGKEVSQYALEVV